VRTLRAGLVAGLQRHDISGPRPFAGIFADLDGDGTDELVLLAASTGWIYWRQGDHWACLGRVGDVTSVDTVVEALGRGEMAVKAQRRGDLVIGTQRLRTYVDQ
jgi:hypothetical protein